MARAPEALSYFLKFRSDFPIPEDERTTADLIDDIVKFCKDGLFDAGEIHRRDENDVEITGSINWLIGEGVTKANFYTAITPAPMLFCLLSDSGSSNWTQLPGFVEFIETNPVILNAGAITLTPHPDLDQLFQDRLTQTQNTPTPRRLALLAALRGEGDLAAALSWIDESNRAENMSAISPSF
jgi:hypothetical protein